MLSWSIGHLGSLPRLAAASATALVLLGLPSTAPSLSGPSVARGATHAIEIGDGFFSPASLTVAVGDTVTWTNVDDSPHTVTASGAFDSGNLNGGQTFSHTFDEAGTFTYVCLYHDEMVAKITVVAASTGSGQAPAAVTPAPSTAAAPAVPAATHSGGAHAGQPDTALPVSASLSAAWIAPLLIGLGLLSLGVGLLPVGAPQVARPASPMPRSTGSGWRR
jgi:plastocyanin